MDVFTFKIVHSQSPPLLNEKLYVNTDDCIANRLKSDDVLKDTVYVPTCRHKYREKTFDYFGAVFYNKFLINNTNKTLETFKTDIYKNINFLHNLFIETFPKYDIKFSYKHFRN